MSISFQTDDAREEADEPRLDGPSLFADRIAAEFAYSLRHGAPLSLIVLEPRDLAEMLAVSDSFWRESVRKSDVVARIDHRRIAVIAPNTNARTAKSVAERLRTRARASMRIGLATMSPPSKFEGPGALLRAAELALD